MPSAATAKGLTIVMWRRMGKTCPPVIALAASRAVISPHG
jgi:hypothetical protein